MLIKEILEITSGKLLCGDPNSRVAPSKISTDSRTIENGGFFIALNGPNFDGNDFAKSAFKKGAQGALVTKKIFNIKDNQRNIILVENALKALQDIASYHRRRFNIPVICVTGSNGKTTTKEMIWKILSSRYNVLKNEGTNNNHIGVPQTLLKLTRDHDMCVLELGTNHKGEIRFLSHMARPTAAVVTNIGPSHLEHIGSLEGVFEAKMEILEFLKPKGKIVLNGDDRFLSKVEDSRFKISKFGLNHSNDFFATDIKIRRSRITFSLNRKKEFQLNVLGLHNVMNALAAIGLCADFDISLDAMKKALYNYRPSKLRLNIGNISGIRIINDAYNSNPLSMECALDALKDYPAKAKWIVSGDMLELGRYARTFHETLGKNIARSDVKGLLTFGRLSKYTFTQAKKCGMPRSNLSHCSNHSEIAKILARIIRKGDVVLIKGSRAMKMEKVVEALKAQS